jgi:hypothetical protein
MGANEILSSGPTGIADFVGQTVTIKSVKPGQGIHGAIVELTLTDGDGEEHLVTTGAAAVWRKATALAEGGHLPIKAVVVSYPSRFGQPGFDLQPTGGGDGTEDVPLPTEPPPESE